MADYRLISHWIDGVPYSVDGVMLDPNVMVDGAETPVPTSDPLLAVSADCITDPITTGRSIGEKPIQGYFTYHYNSVLGIVALHAVSVYTNPDDSIETVDFAYDVLPASVAGLRAESMIDDLMDLIQAGGGNVVDESGLRDELIEMCDTLGYNGAVSAHGLYLHPATEAKMMQDYYRWSAESGKDPYNALNVEKTTPRSWLLTFVDRPINIAQLTRVQRADSSAIYRPELMPNDLRLNLNLVEEDDADNDPSVPFWKVSTETTTGDLAREINLRPVTDETEILVAVEKQEPSSVVLKATINEPKPPAQLRRETAAAAEALIDTGA